MSTRTHLVIPDIQDNPSAPKDHLEWIGKYIIDRKPEVVVNLGDFADMSSLSSYDKGKKSMEGRRYKADVVSSISAMKTLMSPLVTYNAQKRKNKEAQYKPELHLTLGNHEARITRVTDHDAQMDGTISIDDLQYKEYGWTVHDFLKPVNIDGVNYCLAPHHKILTKDLKYIPLGEVKVGQEIVAFDEQSNETRHGRRYKTGIVEKVKLDKAETFRVTLSNGDSFIATNDHRWLVRTKKGTSLLWKHTYELEVGQVFPKLFDTWAQDLSYASGWLAGMFDGEGHISRPNLGQGGIQVGIAQKKGKTLEKIKQYLDLFTGNYVEHSCSGIDVKSIRVLGCSSDKLKLLGTIRPQRLIDKFEPEVLGRVQTRDRHQDPTIISIEAVGVNTIVKIQTSTQTMIVDGYPHHNCHYFYRPHSGKPYSGSIETRLKHIGHSFTQGHEQGKLIGAQTLFDGTVRRGLVVGSCYLYNADYRGPQAASEWRGVIVKYEVSEGNYDIMEVSLDYLCRKYEQMKLDVFMKEKYGVKLG